MARHPTIETPEEFDRLVNEYAKTDGPKTFTGMARFLGFASRQSFYDYEKKDEFSYSVKRAKLLIEEEYERRLQGNNPTGAIFALKNHGWSDRQTVEHSGEIGGVLRVPASEEVDIWTERARLQQASLGRPRANGNGNGHHA